MSDSVEVHVHGQVFKMRASGEDGYIQRVAQYVDGVLAQTASHFGNQPSHRLAIMAAMQIADSLFQEKHRKEESGTEDIKDSLRRLIAQSDRLLGKL